MRSATIRLETGETRIALKLNSDGAALLAGEAGIIFFDHMLHALIKQAGLDLSFYCEGDLHVEATFKASAGALPLAGVLDPRISDIPSSRGIL